ncbi:MAG TPA: tetratricopeptide repeat protein, partial [Bryobacteraceae bacterium]|nr:tetratricopeptide repeat protein [Bryobacteraceae bacterium]
MRTTILCAFLLLCPGVLLSVTSEQAILAIQQRIGAQDLDGAEKSIALALKDDPRNGGLFNLRGIIHAQRQEYDQAAKDFSKAVELSPGLSGAYLNLARIYQLRSKDDDSAVRSAIDVYRRLLRLQPGSV